MRNSQSMVADELSSVLEKLHRQFGVWKLARALAVAAWRQRRAAATNNVDDLSERMLRDIGFKAPPGREELRAARNWQRWI